MNRYFSCLITALFTLATGISGNLYAIPSDAFSQTLPLQEIHDWKGVAETLGTKESWLDEIINLDASVAGKVTASDTVSATVKIPENFKPKLEQSFGQLPMHFEPNMGQTAEAVKFTARGPGYTLFLTDTEAVFSLAAPLKNTQLTAKLEHFNHEEKLSEPEPPQILRMQLAGNTLNLKPKIMGLEKQQGVSNYILGNDKNKWRSGVPHYSKVQYEDVYPGIDLVYYGNPQLLEYDFVVEPGVDPDQIQLTFAGADDIQVANNGDLQLTINNQVVAFKVPVIYQVKDGVKQPIVGHYIIRPGELKLSAERKLITPKIGFHLASYDVNLPLIIDPVMEYSTYYGGTGVESGSGIAVDSNGSAFIAGYTTSIDFPTLNPAFENYGGGDLDVFVTRLDSIGQPVYSTYIGGAARDQGNSIDIDVNGFAYVVGRTYSEDFPTMHSIDDSLGGSTDAFVLCLDSAGQPIYSRYLGGSNSEFGSGIVAGAEGTAYVTGATLSADFDIVNAVYQNPIGHFDAFVTRVDQLGKTIFSTYLGGSSVDIGSGIDVGTNGDVYVTGRTSSSNFPVFNGVFENYSGNDDVFIAHLDNAGQIVNSTYLGGIENDYASDISVGLNGRVCVIGSTSSSDFPTHNAAFVDYAGGDDAYVTCLDSVGQILYSTFLGGTRRDQGSDIVMNTVGDIFITGYTESYDFPTVNGLYPYFQGGGYDAYVTHLDGLGQTIFSTYLGGSSSTDFGEGIDLDEFGSIYITGSTYSSDFPTLNAAYENPAGSTEAFITKFNLFGNQPPVALFNSYEGLSGYSSQTIRFDASVSTDFDGDIVNYQWDFGDGSSGNGITANHTYTEQGSYEVKLTVTDNGGVTAVKTRNFSVVFRAYTLNTVIQSPMQNQTVTVAHTITGIATAPEGLGDVLIGIRDNVTGLWWTGAEWGDWVLQPANLNQAGGNEVDWSYHFDPSETNGSGNYRVYTRAVDINGEQQQVSSQLSFIGTENSDYLLNAIVDMPIHDQHLTAPVILKGTATSPNAVASVVVAIYNVGVSGIANYWNGSGWGAWQLNPASVIPVDDNTVNWEYSFDPTGTGGSGSYRAYVRVLDVTGAKSPSTQVPFLADENIPVPLESIVNTPSANEVINLPYTISGSASAPDGIGTELIAIRDSVSKLWWNGTDWGDWTLMPVPVKPANGTSVDWAYNFDPTGTSHSGQFRVYTRAEDINGARSSSVQVSFSSSDNAMP